MIRHHLLIALVTGLGAAELAIAPEEIVIDARQVAPPPVEVVLGATGQGALTVKAEILDPVAAYAGPGEDVGKPVFPFTIALQGDRVVPGTPGRLTVAYAGDAGSYALRSWQVVTATIRLRSSEVGFAAYDIPVAIRYHARPLIEPAMPLAKQNGLGWEISFALRSADPDEHIAQIGLEGVRMIGSPGAKPITGTLALAEGGACRIAVGTAPAGLLVADLAITYDRPVEARKVLSLRCRLGEPKTVVTKGPTGGPDAPESDAAPAAVPLRRVRIE